MHRAAHFIILALCLLPWVILQSDIRPPGDASFLLFGAEHILSGHSMRNYFYDNNPPMSFLIYTPAALINSFAITPPYTLITFYTMALITLATLSLMITLRYRDDLSQTTKTTIISAFIIGVTIPHMAEFGQKDHLIAIGLIPFIILQNSITNKSQPPLMVTLLILIICAPFILIKPHYGIIPAAIFIHRAAKEKSLRTVFAPDFIILSITALAYIAYTLIFIPEFMREILPMSMKLYTFTAAGNDLSPMFKTVIFLLTSLAFAGLISMQDKGKKEKTFNIFIAAAIFLSIIPFGVQNKGFSLHLIPTTSLFILGVGLYIAPFLKGKLSALIPIIMAATLYLYTWASFGVTGHLTTHDQFKKSELVQSIKTHAKDNPFFIEDTTTCANFISTQYTGNKVASRFPSMWFLGSAAALNEDEKITILETFGNDIATDINRHKPQMIAFMLNENNKSPLKVIYKNHPKMQDSLAHYEYKETRKINNIDHCTRAYNNTYNKLTLEIHTRKE